MCDDNLGESLRCERIKPGGPVIDPNRSSRQAWIVRDADYCLIDGLQRGKVDAFESLVEKYRKPIIDFASRFLGDPSEAHDVAQNVFVQVFKRSDYFQFRSKVSTWLYTIARNLCHNEQRRRLRQKTDPIDTFSSHPATIRHIAEATYQSELEQKIEESLASLPAKQRAAILLLQSHDLSYAEIAVALRTTVSATKALIHRGRQELKRQLRPYLRTGSWPAKPTNRTVLEFKPGEGYGGRQQRLLSAVSAVAGERRRAA